MRARATTLAAAVLAVWSWTQSAAAEPVRIALLPVSVHSSTGETAYLSTGLREMLSARLEQYSDVRVAVLDGEGTLDEKEAVERARGAQAEYVVYGSFTQFGKGASLDLRCARVDDPQREDEDDETARRVFVQAGALGQIIPQLDTLARKITSYAAGGAAQPPDVAAGGGDAAAGGASPEQLQEILRRLEALEQAVYTPVAAKPEAEPAQDGSDG